MHAVRIHEFGGPEVLKLDDVPDPEPGRGEVLIEVRASSVNPVDYKIRNGGFIPPDQLPVTLGRDISGVVRRCGPGERNFEPHQAVYAMLPSDRGGYAELVAIPESVCARKPERLDFVQAAAVPLAALTAWQGLFDQGRLEQGQVVLIHGGAGGVGHFAIQFARARGAQVITTCAAEDEGFVLSLGAKQVIDYKAERFEDEVEKVDLVFDLIGGDTLERSYAVVRPSGAIVSTLQAPDKKKLAERGGVRGAHYRAQPNGEQLEQIGRLIDSGRVTPAVDRTYPLARAAEAEEWLEHRHVRGKIVVTVH
jgi:NADPH:quinone reductase-like Zn-dependent oxidoreductase